MRFGNSTQVANRMFRTQRYVVFVIAGSFILLLIILSLTAHKQLGLLKVDSSSDSGSSSSKLTGGHFGAVLDAEREKEAEEEEAQRLKEDQDQKDKEAKGGSKAGEKTGEEDKKKGDDLADDTAQIL